MSIGIDEKGAEEVLELQFKTENNKRRSTRISELPEKRVCEGPGPYGILDHGNIRTWLNKTQIKTCQQTPGIGNMMKARPPGGVGLGRTSVQRNVSRLARNDPPQDGISPPRRLSLFSVSHPPPPWLASGPLCPTNFPNEVGKFSGLQQRLHVCRTAARANKTLNCYEVH